MAAFLAVLPLTEAVIRWPSVAVGAIDVVLLYFIAKRVFQSERWAVVAAIFLMLTPSHFVHSRMAMDYLYPVPFLLTWLLCLLIYLDRRHSWTLVVATSALGLGVFSYIASAIMMPVYLLLTGLALFKAGVGTTRPYLAAAEQSWNPIRRCALAAVSCQERTRGPSSAHGVPRFDESRCALGPGRESGADDSGRPRGSRHAHADCDAA